MAIPFSGPVEVDEELLVGGKRRNMSLSKRKGLTGRGPRRTRRLLVAIKDSKKPEGPGQGRFKDTDQPTLQGFVIKNTTADSMLYTDEAAAYNGRGYPESS